MEKVKDNFKQDFVKLLDLLAQVDNVSEPPAKDLRLIDANWLVKKLICHVLTLNYLIDGINYRDLSSFKSLKKRFPEPVSIDVLTRAALESFLVFHYVFFAPVKTEEKDFRYWAYKAAGIMERQKYPINNEEYRQKLENEKIELSKFRHDIKSNIIFQGLTTEGKRKILKGEWKLESWSKIAIDAGFSDVLASDMYRYLCGYAHSDYLSVIQTREILISKYREKEQAINVSIGILNIVIANTIEEYRELFPTAQGVLSQDHEGNNLVKQYVEIGRILDKHMGAGRKNV